MEGIDVVWFVTLRPFVAYEDQLDRDLLFKVDSEPLQTPMPGTGIETANAELDSLVLATQPAVMEGIGATTDFTFTKRCQVPLIKLQNIIHAYCFNQVVRIGQNSIFVFEYS